MKYMSLVGGLVAILANIPLIVGIFKNEIKQSFASWMLWACLDVIATSSIILQDGNFWLPLAYAVGSTMVSISLLYKKQFSWTTFETFVLGLVLVCLIVWFYSGSRMATIASVSALLIASMPQVKVTIRLPESTPTKIYLLFCIANTLSLFGPETWTLENKLYSFVASIICIALAVLSVRKTETI